MKISAAFILILISFLLLQPLLSGQAKMLEGSGHYSSSHNHGEKHDSDEDPLNLALGNPFMNGEDGDFFMEDHPSFAIEHVLPLPLNTPAFIERGYISQYPSDCWRPPELL